MAKNDFNLSKFLTEGQYTETSRRLAEQQANLFTRVDYGSRGEVDYGQADVGDLKKYIEQKYAEFYAQEVKEVMEDEGLSKEEAAANVEEYSGYHVEPDGNFGLINYNEEDGVEFLRGTIDGGEFDTDEDFEDHYNELRDQAISGSEDVIHDAGRAAIGLNSNSPNQKPSSFNRTDRFERGEDLEEDNRINEEPTDKHVVVVIGDRAFYVDQTMWDPSMLNGTDEENAEFLLDNEWEEVQIINHTSPV